jgi:predicted ferric reductase
MGERFCGGGRVTGRHLLDWEASVTAAPSQALRVTPAHTARRKQPALVHPALAGRLVLWTAVLVNEVLVDVLFLGSAPAGNALVTIGRFLGLQAALIMVLQLVLVARIPWLDRRIGMDGLTSWHRWTGFTLFWVILLHPAFIVLGYAQSARLPVLREFVNFAGQFGTLLGMGAAAVIVVVAVASIRFARRHLRYETWHAVHLATYLAVLFAVIHQVYEGSTFNASTLTRAYWWTLWALAVLALIAGRAAVPLWRNALHRLRVAAVVPESDNVVSVYVTGRHLDRLPARAGQFFIWRFLTPGGWWQANPFSLSAAPDGRYLRLTAKAVGSGSARLRHLRVGTRVFAEGPYGALTVLQQTKTATLLIAGGVGITPLRALLEELRGHVIVLYRVRTPADAVLVQELTELARRRGATLHLISGRTRANAPANNPFHRRNLGALVPDVTHRDVFVCGPSAMTSLVLRSLRELGVPRTQVHAERFSLAG